MEKFIFVIETSLRDALLAFECLRDANIRPAQIASNSWGCYDTEDLDEILDVFISNKVEHQLVINPFVTNPNNNE